MYRHAHVERVCVCVRVRVCGCSGMCEEVVQLLDSDTRAEGGLYWEAAVP